MEKNCKECLHNTVCQMWRDQEGQDASSFQLSGCIHFDTGKAVPGRWEHSESMILSAKCSKCKGWATKHSVNEPDFNYCPNCGAKMDGDGNG